MKLVITGATGYIGEVLMSRARQAGCQVVAAARARPLAAHDDWLQFDLASTEAIELPADTDVVIHLAADTHSFLPGGQETEVQAAERLTEAAKKVSARLLFVSSQAAVADAPTAYGQTKWRIEEQVLTAGGCVVRPGQVYGGPERGLYGELLQTLRRSKFVPKFVPSPMVQPVHVADLADGLLNLCSATHWPKQVLNLGAVQAMPFSDFLTGIADHNKLPKPRFIPVPVWLVRIAGWCAGQKLRDRLGISRLKSLFELQIMDTRESLQMLDLKLRPFPGGEKNPEFEIRQRARQSTALLSYVLKESPGPELHRRYAAVLEHRDKEVALRLPQTLLRFPALLSVLDSPARNNPAHVEFLQRLEIAVVMAEASPQGARRFLGTGRAAGFWSSLTDISLAVVSEVFWRIVRVFFAPLAAPEITVHSAAAPVHHEP